MKCNIKIGGHTKKSNKNNKKVKDYSYWERLEKLGLISQLERRMRGDLIETFKIIEFLNMVDIFFFFFFSVFLFKLEIYYRDISKTKSTNQLDIFAKRVIYIFGINCLIKSKVAIV